MDESAWILCNGNNEETIISKSPFNVGRNTSFPMVCESIAVSREHASFVIYPNGTLYVQDNKSSNGTYINGRRIDPHRLHQLHVNDEVGLGLHSQLNLEASGLPKQDVKYIIFTVKKRISNGVIVLDDEGENVNVVQSVVNCATDSPITSEKLLDILGSDNESNASQNHELPIAVDAEKNRNFNLRRTTMQRYDENEPSTSFALPLNQNNETHQPSTSVCSSSSSTCDLQRIEINKPSSNLENNSALKSANNENGKQLYSNSTLNNLQTNSIKEAEDKRLNSVSSTNHVISVCEPERNINKASHSKSLENHLQISSTVELKNKPTTSISSVNHVEHLQIHMPSTSSSVLSHIENNHISDLQVNETGIDKDRNILENIVVKQEVVDNSNNLVGNEYTVEDGCIIIGDDDDEFPCSQLLLDEPTSNKFDQDFLNESLFCTIKKELEELDRPENGRVYACVDLLDSDEESDHNWMSDDETNEKKEEETENCQTVLESNIQETENNKESIPNKSSKNKYSIPPVITPHVETKRKAHRNSEKPSKNKMPEKRKLVEKEDEQSKKIKTSTFYNEKDKRDTGWKRKGKQQETVTKETKEIIHEIRKRKLKEIAEKKAEETEKKIPKSKTATAKVKVSDSRGNFLMQNIDMPSTSKATHISANVPLRTRTTSSDYKKPSHSKYTKNSSSSNKAVITDRVPINNNNHTCHSTSTPFIPKSVIPVQAVTRNDIPRNCEGIQDILKRFLKWKTVWIQNWKENKINPPIHDKPLNRISQSFSNYKEYYNVVMPLLELELWNYVVKGILDEKDPRKKKFLAHIERERKTDNYTELECFTYITKQQSDTNCFIKEEDAVIVQFAFRQNGPYSIAIPMLAYVTDVKKQILNERDYIDADFGKALAIAPRAVVTFRILVQPYNGTVEVDRYMHIRIITSLIPTTRVIRSVKHLENSSLCQHILKPSLPLYTVSPTNNKKLFLRNDLNSSQYEAVMEATEVCLRNKPGIYLIQGPPGTGKSTVIVNIIQQILFRELNNNSSKQCCILVVAPSNAAVDELTKRLIQLKPKLEASNRKELKLVRLGPANMISSAVLDYSLGELTKKNIMDSYFNTHDPTMLNKLSSLQQKIIALKENGNSPRDELKKCNSAKVELEKTCKKMMGRSWNENFRKTENLLLEKARIVCTTLSSCVGKRMEEAFGGPTNKIQCCIVDEATQSSEQETLIPLMLGINKMVLVGDPKQLPAVTLSREAKDCAYGQSLFSRIMSNFEKKLLNPIKMLDTQYRMNPEICEFPNKTFYGGKLKNAPIVTSRSTKLNILKPYLVLNFKMEQVNSQEYLNRAEIECVIKLLNAIVYNIKNTCTYSIGIVTPYNDQKAGINAEIRSKTFGRNVSITVNTVDSFQGQEKDIMIMSCVRDYSNSFIRDEQRLNVAMTRAVHALYIVGSDSLLRSCESLGKVYDNAKKRYLIKVVSSKTTIFDLSNIIKAKHKVVI